MVLCVEEMRLLIESELVVVESVMIAICVR
jgi:hypothetical protein